MPQSQDLCVNTTCSRTALLGVPTSRGVMVGSAVAVPDSIAGHVVGLACSDPWVLVLVRGDSASTHTHTIAFMQFGSPWRVLPVDGISCVDQSMHMVHVTMLLHNVASSPRQSHSLVPTVPHKLAQHSTSACAQKVWIVA
jgi:hypothetical protein